MKRVTPPSLLGFLASIYCGCRDDSRPDIENEACVSDPQARRVAPDDCEHSGECPSGTRCANGRCSPALFVPGTTTLLTSGFDVPRMELTELGSGQYTYRSPANSLFVMCAEFVCLPEFTGNNHEIANFEQCVTAYDTFTGEEAVVERVALTRSPSRPAIHCREDVTLEVLARGRTEGAWFGCWSYGETEVVRASRLVPSSAESIAIIDDCRSCSDVSEHCDPFASRPETMTRLAFVECRTSTLQVGVCVQDECRRWCRDDDDCRGPISGCDPKDEFCLPATSECLELEGSWLGVCADDGRRGPTRTMATDG